MTTLAEFLPQHLQQHALPDQLGGVLQSVVDACVQINRQVRLGALAGLLAQDDGARFVLDYQIK